MDNPETTVPGRARWQTEVIEQVALGAHLQPPPPDGQLSLDQLWVASPYGACDWAAIEVSRLYFAVRSPRAGAPVLI